MIEKNEDSLIKFIKYSPLIVIIILSFIITSFLTIQNTNTLEKQIEDFKVTYSKTQKAQIKSEVDSVLRNINNESTSSLKDLKLNLKNRVYEAYALIENIHKNNKNLADEKILKLIKDALRNIRFNEGRGYYFLDDANANVIMNPINPALEGKNYYNSSDSKALEYYDFDRKVIDIIKNDTEAYDEYEWQKANIKNKTFKKISFIKSFKPLNIAIGAGEYFEDYENQLKEHIILEHISNAKFGKNGYVFVVDYKGVYLSHPKKEYINKNRINLKDKNGFEITKELIKAGQNNTAYLSYMGTYMPQSGKHAKKITYVQSYSPWKWVIAAGFYDKELQKIIEQKREKLKRYNEEYTKKILLTSIIITILLILLSIKISKIVKNYFLAYSRRIRVEEQISREKDNVMHHQSKMALMGEMIENIAHQWKQPLSAISTAASGIVVNKEYGVIDEKAEIAALNNISSNVKYLSHTIDDFRDFFSSNKNINEFVVSKTIEKTLVLLSSKFKNQNILLVNNMCDATLKGLENEFIQVLMNILNNAKDALSKNEGERYIFINVKNEKDFVEINIADNAGGIHKSIIEKVFDPHFTTKEYGKGTGIGLYMTKEIVESHMKGTITVSNEEIFYNDKTYFGANFKIKLKKNYT